MSLTRNQKVWLSAVAAGSVAALVIFQRRHARAVLPSRLAHDPTECAVWRFDNRLQVLPPGKTLRLELGSPATVRWTTNQWSTVHDTRAVPVDALYVADLDTGDLPAGTRLQFTFYWPEVNRWEGQDFEVRISESARYGGAISD
jgi:hypothetical protein